jgi:hypothetical protein
MFRESDINCSGPDQAPEDEKKQKFRERWECLSRESSDLVNILKFKFPGLQHMFTVDGAG